MQKTFLRSITKVLLPLLIVVASSCSEGACFDETQAYLKASFYRRNPLKLTSPDSLTLYGTGKPGQPIYKRKTGVQPALMPLNASGGSCGFVMKINGVNDTVEFHYSTFPALISKECGYSFFHDLETVTFTTNIIDSVKISKRRVTNLNEENIRIYY